MAEVLRSLADLGTCPHGNGPDCEICLRERLEPGLKLRAEWQEQGVRGEVDGFGPGIEVGFALRRSVKKTGAERGQDMVLADRETKLSGVLDGLGGVGETGAGAEASAYAAELMPEIYKSVSGSLAALDKIGKLKPKIDDLVADQYAGLTVAERRKESADDFRKRWEREPEAVRMESLRLYHTIKLLNARLEPLLIKGKGTTTLVVGKTIEVESRRYEVIVNVGDSAAYRHKADGTVEQVTTEDSAVQRALENGLITESDLKRADILQMLSKKLGWTPGQILAVVMETLGRGKARPRVTAVPVVPGDRIIYASDGLDKGFETKGDPLARLDTKMLAKAIDPGLKSAVAAAALRDEAMRRQVYKDDCVVVMKRFA